MAKSDVEVASEGSPSGGNVPMSMSLNMPMTMTMANPRNATTIPGNAAVNAVPTANATTRHGKAPKHSSKFGTVNYSVDEMRRLNDKVRGVLPITSEEWLHVTYQFNYMRPESIPYREVDSLKRKFKKMYCSRGAALPAYVQEAKVLRKMINQRSERTQLQEGTESTTTPTPSSEGGTSEVATRTSEMEIGASSGGQQEDEEGSSTNELSAGLRGMEESMGQGQSMGHRGTRRLPRSLSASSDSIPMSMAMSMAMPMAGNTLNASGPAADINAGIIHLLKHSIERKRRTLEEQILSESERVRKERKKRKTEQVFYNLHREHEIATGSSPGSGAGTSPNAAATAAAAMAATTSEPSPVGSSIGSGLAGFLPTPMGVTLPTIPGSSSSTTSNDTASLPLMEMLLQFMLAQQQEVAQQRQADDERRRREAIEREQRRRAKDLQRRRDKHEMMVLMAALLKNEFPSELRRYLAPVREDDEGALQMTTELGSTNGNSLGSDHGNGANRTNATLGSGAVGEDDSTRTNLCETNTAASSPQVSIAVEDTLL